jgi:hypothetical protein
MNTVRKVDPKAYYLALIESMPYGLEKAISRILLNHIGEENGIFKFDLISSLKSVGFNIDERHLRMAIYNLRHDGWLIGSLSTAGYFLIKNRQEFEKVAKNEFQEKIDNMKDTLDVMTTNANKQLGQSYQPGMQI